MLCSIGMVEITDRFRCSFLSAFGKVGEMRMNVLLIGSSCSLMDNMIKRLHKEGHRIFLLTADKEKGKQKKFVFETYHFDYVNESVPQVFESVRPDVTLYFGACDPGTKLENEPDSVRYFSGMVNLLVSFSMTRRGRFVYLSTSDIFEDGAPGLITEEQKPSCVSPRALVLAQAEEICESYRRNLNLDTVVLRMDHIYTIPENRAGVRDRCSEICLSAWEKKTVFCVSDDTFSLLDEGDAVEFIHRVVACREHREGLYNISSSVPITEEDIFGYLSELDLGELKQSKKPAEGKHLVLSNKRYQDEFGMRFFSDARKMAQNTLLYMQANSADFQKPKKKRQSFIALLSKKLGWLYWILVPYVENLIAFVPFFMLNNRAVGSKYFDRLDFYLIYVLLFAIVYGQQQATFSAILATAGYCFRQMYAMSGFEVFSSYNTYVWLAQLFIVGLVVGYMRDKLREQAIENAEEQNYLNNRIGDIYDINRSNVRVKDSLRTQIINQNNSVGKVYEITSTLNQYSTEEVLFYAADIMARLMETKDVAVYLISNDTYARLFSSTSVKAKCMGRSIRYRETGEMFQTLSEHRVFINRKLDQNLPMMANAIFEGENIQIIVMAWGIPWEAMTLGQANLMSVISALIREAVLRAGRYMAALEDQRYEEGRILKREAFTVLAEAFLKAREKGLTDCTFLRHKIADMAKDAQGIRGALRQSDYIGVLDDEYLYVLLSNTIPEDAHFAVDRLKGRGFDVSIVEELPL